MNVPETLKYMKSHEWAKKENNKIRVGITDHAQKEITDVVHVELPESGREVEHGKPCAVVESVKSAFDIYAPVSGKIVEINKELLSNPELVNKSPYEKGFFFLIEPSNPQEWDNLLSAKEYQESLK